MTHKPDMDSVPRGIGGKKPGGQGSPQTAMVVVALVALVSILAVVIASLSGGANPAQPMGEELAEAETEIGETGVSQPAPPVIEPAPGAQPEGVVSGAAESLETPELAGTATVATEDQRRAVLTSVQTLRTRGNMTQARTVLAEAVVDYPDDPTLRLAFAEFLIERGDAEAAAEQYEAAISVGSPDPAVSFAAGVASQASGDTSRALEHYWEAHRLDPTNPDYPLYRAQAEMSMGMLDEAVASLSMANRLEPDRAQVWGMMAEVALRQNYAEIALQHAGRARDLEPRTSAWSVLQARALTRAARPGEALAVLEELPRASRMEKSVLRAMGECLGMLRRPADAAALYVEASESMPSDPELAHDAAVWIDRAGDSAGAIMFAERAESLGHPGAGALLQRLRSDAG
ncbi:MAG: tetratricopeptide repeat protein [Planctomycetota bacterium]